MSNLAVLEIFLLKLAFKGREQPEGVDADSTLASRTAPGQSVEGSKNLRFHKSYAKSVKYQ